MLKSKYLKWISGIACLCLMIILSSCAASRKMGCPMQFSRVAPAGQAVPTDLFAFADK